MKVGKNMCYENVWHVPEFIHVTAIAVEDNSEVENSSIMIAFQVGVEPIEALYIDEFINLLNEVENG